MNGGLLATLQKHQKHIVFWVSLAYPFTVGALLYFLMPDKMGMVERTMLYCIAPVYPLMIWQWLPAKINPVSICMTICGLAVHCVLYTTLIFTLLQLYFYVLGGVEHISTSVSG